MTPEYASPEQIRGEAVTTASAVYSLGVVLYELLTGRRPFRLRDYPLQDVPRVLSDLDPERPSAVVTRSPAGAGGTSGARTPEELSRARGSDPRRLRRRLRGDLDNVVLMAMAKDPARRYATAFQLAEDLRRHLDGEPVLARRPTLLYRAGKLARRNRIAVALGAAFLALLLGFAANRANLAAQLARERDRARREADTTRHVLVPLQDVLRAARPAGGEAIAPRALLDRALEAARAELQDEPEAYTYSYAPHVTTILTGVFVGVFSAIANIDDIVQLTNIGTLFAFILVALGILVLRAREPERPRPFRVPLVPLVPLLGAGMCVFLMAGLPRVTWERFGLWLVAGLVVYWSYGRTHSRLARG